MPQLVAPNPSLMASFVEALGEGYDRDTLRPETPETIARLKADPAGYLADLAGPPGQITLPDGSTGPAVASTTLWYVRGDHFIGAINIRHELNANLAIVGGHIGYVVRPSERGRGHASDMLAGALAHTRAHLPLKRVLLTVNALNTASIRVIEKNGGVHTKSVPHLWHPGDTAMHWWIEV